MKVVVLGGSGLIGSKLVAALGDWGHEVVAASPRYGINSVTGEGLSHALEGADVVVDVTNSPSFQPDAVLAFFETSTRNVLEAESIAGVGHHVVLSIVGVERLSDGSYFRAKIAQEKLVRDSPIPYSIVRATQFFEFIGGIAERATRDSAVHLPPALFQPIAADEVATFVAGIAVGPPVNGVVEVAGPRPYQLDELAREYLRARGDRRLVLTDPSASYSGAHLGERTLLPSDKATLGEIDFEDWRLSGSVPT